MIIDLYEMLPHNVLFCFWSIPAILIAVIMVVMAVTHNHKQKKREKEFEKELAEANAAPAAQIPETAQA